jgi:pentose-5-phosphate-3-epimerase
VASFACSVALNPHTPAEMIENVLDLVDHVLVMTVNPGFGGQAYIPTMTDKIRKIRKWGVDRGLDFDIEVRFASKSILRFCQPHHHTHFVGGLLR